MTIDFGDVNTWSEYMEDFKPPRRAGEYSPYVLFGKVAVECSGSNPELKPSTHCLRLSGGKGDRIKVQSYLGKKYQILKWWLPELKDLPPKRQVTESGWKSIMRETMQDPFADVRHFLKEREKEQSALQARKEKENEYEKRIKELEEKLKDEQHIHTKAPSKKGKGGASGASAS